MSAEPYTPAELEAGAGALRDVRHVIASDGCVSIVIGTADQDAATVLRAVLPDHDARVRADERARVARMLVDQAARERAGSVDQVVMLHASELARSHATTPTTEGDPDA